ncbi:MAG: iron-containing alcohol dehydrogenase [Treponema sp.]|nr:MAG: iron-containing alcohol dehydrogenase [Treponema sp.]
MNVLKIAVFRLRQKALRAASYFVHWHVPAAFQGDSALADLAAFIARRKISRVLVVTDRMMVSLGIARKLFDALGSSGIEHSVFAEAMSDPTTEAAYAAAAQYKDSGCAAVIAIGGGSAIDCAKAASAVLSRPGMPLERMAGILKVLRRRVPLFAVPTTAGTIRAKRGSSPKAPPVRYFQPWIIPLRILPTQPPGRRCNRQRSREAGRSPGRTSATPMQSPMPLEERTAFRTVLPAPYRCRRFSKATGAPRGGRLNGLPKAQDSPLRPTASFPNCARSTNGSDSPLLFRAYGRKISKAFRRPRSAKRILHIRFPAYSTTRK